MQNLVGDIGGTLGFWIGASVISLIHVFLFFLCRKRNTVADLEEAATVGYGSFGDGTIKHDD